MKNLLIISVLCCSMLITVSCNQQQSADSNTKKSGNSENVLTNYIKKPLDSAKSVSAESDRRNEALKSQADF